MNLILKPLNLNCCSSSISDYSDCLLRNLIRDLNRSFPNEDVLKENLHLYADCVLLKLNLINYCKDHPPPAIQRCMVPLFVSDLKLSTDDYNKAFTETAAYAVRIMEDHDWRSTHHSILIGLPMTLKQTSNLKTSVF